MTTKDKVTDQKAIGYCRVSTREQSETGVSIDAQIEKIKSFAAYKGIKLIAIVKEEGVSGSVPLKKRMGGQTMLTQISEGRANTIIATKLDRLFRDAHDCLSMVKEWEKTDTKLHLLDLGVDFTKATGKAFLTSSATFAELERNLISERTKDGLEQVKREGVKLGGEGLGWRRTNERDAKGRLKQELVLEELNLILKIKALRAEGFTYQAICNQLMAEGIPTKKGGNWHPTTVRNIIKSSIVASGLPSNKNSSSSENETH